MLTFLLLVKIVVINIQISESDKVKDLKSSIKSRNNYYLIPGKDESVKVTDIDIMKIAKIIDDEIFVVYPSLNYIYNYFIEMAEIAVKLNIPLSWITPQGMEIVQYYLVTEEKKIGINIFGKRRKVVLKSVIDKLNTSKQIQAIIPNIIHSLDASHLMKVILSCVKSGCYPVITIHDCFGTHPNKMEKLSYKVKSEFALLYTKENFLMKFHRHILSNIRANNYKVALKNGLYFVYSKKDDAWINIPEVPKLGKLNLNGIEESSYMIM